MIRRIITSKFFVASVALVATGLTAAAFIARRDSVSAAISTLPITRGDVVETVSATGSLEAIRTVQVGAQVSGNIQALYADFNSLVRKGQVLARIDPNALESQVEQARAAVVKAEADVDRLKVSLETADLQLERTRKLADKQIAAPSDLDAAVVSRRTAEAQLKSAEASLLQVRASLSQAVVNLEKTVILSPIDGIVVSRNVDVGQTVAASMQAPTLFVLAADLTKMRVGASIDESDIGRIVTGQQVRFTVDAFPAEEFAGTVAQVRLSPTVTQSVVTYQTLIDVPNLELKLRPGMTANVTVETRRRDNVLRASNSTLRFKPTAEMFALLGQAAPGAGNAAAGGVGARSTPTVVNVRFEPTAPAAGTAGRVVGSGRRCAHSDRRARRCQRRDVHRDPVTGAGGGNRAGVGNRRRLADQDPEGGAGHRQPVPRHPAADADGAASNGATSSRPAARGLGEAQEGQARRLPLCSGTGVSPVITGTVGAQQCCARRAHEDRSHQWRTGDSGGAGPRERVCDRLCAILPIWMAGAALLLAQLGPPAPQAPKCAVTGTATAGALRLPGVAITVTSAEGGNPLTTSTQLDGRFSLEVPGPGRYQMTGESCGVCPRRNGDYGRT